MKRTLMKRLLAFGLALAVMAGVLTGCGASSSTSSPTSANSIDGTGNPNASRENVTIRFSQYANNTDDQAYMAEDPIKKAIEEAVNVTIEYDTGIEGYDDRLATELAVGAAPDLFPTWGAASTMRKYVEEEAVYNIGEIINANPDRYPILHKIINHPTYKMYNKMYTGDENATYAIYSFSARAYPNFNGVPAYNTSILNEVNDGKVPTTVSEFVQFTQNAVDAGYSGWWPFNNKLTNWAEIDRTIANPLGTTLRTPATWD